METSTASRSTASFAWPTGVRAAVSLSFDDGRASQLEVGLPILDAHDVKATFYIMPRCLEGSDADAWRRVAAAGHEIGNHTVNHPCTGNFQFARPQALEAYTLDRMVDELDGAQQIIHDRLGITPTSFAYPCGQTFVGRGEHVQSYIPLVAQRFPFARSYRDERGNDPAFCDYSQLLGVNLDRVTGDEVQARIDDAMNGGGWLVLAGHDVARTDGHQAVLAETLEHICRLAGDGSLWVDTVSNVGQYVREQRDEPHAGG